MQGRRKRKNIFKVLKEKNWQPRILYLAKVPFKNESKIKIFCSDKQKPRKYITRRSIPQETLKKAL